MCTSHRVPRASGAKRRETRVQERRSMEQVALDPGSRRAFRAARPGNANLAAPSIYCAGVKPDAFTAGAQRSESAFWIAANSAGVEPVA